MQKFLNKSFIRILFILSINCCCDVGAQSLTVTLNSATSVPSDFFGYNGSNVIRPENPYWDDSLLVNKFSDLCPANSRFPAGEIANWWDWRTGCIKTNIPQNIVLRGDLESLNYKDNTLKRYKTLVDRSVVTPLFDLNLMTSNKYFEAAGLYYANGLNLPVKYIEFGTEFYLEKDEYMATYPTAANYATDANAWAAYLRTLPGGSAFKIAALGAVDKFPAEPHYSRQNMWTPQLLPLLSGDINAVTLHNYVGGNTGVYAVSLTNLPSVMAAPFQSWASLTSELNLIRSFNKDVWITEYNLFDRNHCLQGTWASGLFAAAMQLTFNEDTLVKVTTCHTMVGSGVWSMIFNNTTGFDFNDFYYEGTYCLGNAPASDPYEFSAAGNTMSLVGRAMRDATTRKKLSFVNAPTLPGNFPVIYGWQFDGPVKTSAVILNMDSVDRTITIDTATWNLTSATMLQQYAGPGGPLALIKGNAVANPGVYEAATTNTIAATQTILLRKYSITYIEKKKPVVLLKVMDNTVCSGSSTSVAVHGGSTYTWSGGNLSSLSPDNGTMRFNAPVVSAATSYTLTVTDVSGATASASITVYPKPVLNTSVNFQQVCKGYPIKLSAALTGANAANFQSFIWIQDDGKEISNCMNPVVNVNPTKSTSYFVVATDGLCWANIDSQKVVVNAVADAGTNRFVCTDSLPFTLTAKNIQSGFTYKWYLNNNLLATGTSVAVSPVTKTTYKLTMVSNTDNQCTDTATITLDPVVCCPSADTSALTFGNYITSKNFGTYMQAYCAATGQGTAGASSLSDFHKEIVFNGTLAIDRTFTFYNCDKIRFGERAEIKYIANGQVLTFDKCNLGAATCTNKMWSGIKANLFNVTLNLDSTFISGAEKAVEAQDDAILYINYSTLKNNYKGIDIFDYNDELEGAIKGDSFIYTSLLPPHAGQRPFCGVCTDDVTGVRIGDSTYTEPPNYFSNLDYGVYSPDATIDFYNNTFVNFYPDDTINTNEGSAIYCFNKNGGGNLTDTAQLWPLNSYRIGNAGGGTKGNTFLNCKYAINASNVGLIAKGNTFNNATKAITCKDAMLKTLEASSNTIDKSKTSIEFILPKGSSLTINSNTITTDTAYNDQSVMAGIRVIDDPLNMSTLAMDGNVVNLYGTHGIFITTNDYGKFIDNRVNIKQNNLGFDVYGFRFEDCDSADFSCNAAKGNSALQMNHKRGIVVINSDQWRLRCSNIDKVDIGMELIGNCNWMQLRNNEYYNSNVALQIGADGLAGGKIGPQPQFGVLKPTGNKFFGNALSTRGTFGVAATRAVNSYCAGGQFDTTRFYVYNIDSVWVPWPNILSGTGSAITPYYTNKNPNPCNATCDNPNPLRPRPKHKESPVITNEDDEPMSVENYEAVAKNFVQHSTDAMQYSDMQSLYNYCANNTDAVNASDDLKKFKALFDESNVAAFSKIKSIVSELSVPKTNSREDVVQSALAMNHQIIPENTSEQNEKVLNETVLQRLASGKNYSPEQKESLRSIAFQCPYTGGDAVFAARAVYSQFVSDINYNDELLCAQAPNEFTNSKSIKPSPFVKVYPVPANEILNVEYVIPDNQFSEIVFTDLSGRTILRQNMNPDYMHASLNLSSVKDGIYVLQIFSANQLIQSVKVAVIK